MTSLGKKDMLLYTFFRFITSSFFKLLCCVCLGCVQPSIRDKEFLSGAALQSDGLLRGPLRPYRFFAYQHCLFLLLVFWCAHIQSFPVSPLSFCLHLFSECSGVRAPDRWHPAQAVAGVHVYRTRRRNHSLLYDLVSFPLCISAS